MPVFCLFLLRDMPLELMFAPAVHLEKVICSFRPFARALLFFVLFPRVVTEVNSSVLGVLSRLIQELVRSDSCEQFRTWGCAFAKWSLTMGVRGDLVGDGVQPLRPTPRTPGLTHACIWPGTSLGVRGSPPCENGSVVVIPVVRKPYFVFRRSYLHLTCDSLVWLLSGS